MKKVTTVYWEAHIVLYSWNGLDLAFASVCLFGSLQLLLWIELLMLPNILQWSPFQRMLISLKVACIVILTNL